MDEAVKATTLKLLAAVCALGAVAAHAQALVDPTRPPASLLRASGAQAVAAPQGPRLQSILISRAPGGRHIAVIDGQTVRPGDTFKGARVERMTQTEVVLSKDGRKQVLKLFPAQPAGQRTSAKHED
jgi:MSHA biogenesis protein MshK